MPTTQLGDTRDLTSLQPRLRRTRHRVFVILALIGALLLGTGCDMESTGATGGFAKNVNELKQLADNCTGPLNGYVALDLSASARGDAKLIEERLQALRDATSQVAACGGYMKAVAFSSTASETFTLGEAEFPTSFGTETARLIQGGKVRDEVLGDVEGNLAAAERHLNPNGSDILSQLALAAQYQAQRGEGTLYADLLTDGVATTRPVLMNKPTFTDGVARSEAMSLSLPGLAGAEVRVAGIGRITSTHKLHSARIEAISDFYEIACRQAKAQCLVTTDYTKGA